MRSWSLNGQPSCFWLPGFFFPQGFLTGVLQNHSRKYQLPIDALTFAYDVTDIFDGEENVGKLSEEDGVLISGLYMEGARWDTSLKTIQDSYSMEMYSVSF